MEAEQENNGDQNLLRNDLGDNRGTKIKREIPQLLIFNELRDSTVPRTGLEPARLTALAPETSASTIPPPGQGEMFRFLFAKIVVFVGVGKFFCAFFDYPSYFNDMLLLWILLNI